nr:methyl-accepting chemotaxis protein [Campylobacter fetus]
MIILNTLQGKIGSDINVIKKTFDDFKNLDFTSNIPNAKGEVEKVTNLLGNEITNIRNITDQTNLLALNAAIEAEPEITVEKLAIHRV